MQLFANLCYAPGPLDHNCSHMYHSSSTLRMHVDCLSCAVCSDVANVKASVLSSMTSASLFIASSSDGLSCFIIVGVITSWLICSHRDHQFCLWAVGCCLRGHINWHIAVEHVTARFVSWFWGPWLDAAGTHLLVALKRKATTVWILDMRWCCTATGAVHRGVHLGPH